MKPSLIIAGIVGAAIVGNAPAAIADEDPWGANLGPESGPSAMMSINYALAAGAGQYPTSPPGMWQVYATPPGEWVPPGPQNFCGMVASQDAPTPDCPAGWDLWYR